MIVSVQQLEDMARQQFLADTDLSIEELHQQYELEQMVLNGQLSVSEA